MKLLIKVSKNMREIRKGLYKKALKQYETYSSIATDDIGESHIGICGVLVKLYRLYVDSLMTMDKKEEFKRYFPEICSSRPKDKAFGEYWWTIDANKEESWTERIKALKKAIKLCK